MLTLVQRHLSVGAFCMVVPLRGFTQFICIQQAIWLEPQIHLNTLCLKKTRCLLPFAITPTVLVQ